MSFAQKILSLAQIDADDGELALEALSRIRYECETHQDPAPELLAACVDVLGYFMHTRHGREWVENGGQEAGRLSAAIAKARGEAVTQ